MKDFDEWHIPAKGLQSLVWQGDELIDWAGGGARYRLSGERIDRSVYFSKIFNASVASPSNDYVVIYTRFGTKGVILKNGKILREINRSYYHADAYEYPIALLQLPNGREIMAHCPEEYCQLEFEDLTTGERLTRLSSRKPADIFHSRLAASPDGKYLISAGWLWHPIDCVNVFSIPQALENPTHLDKGGLDIGQELLAEQSSAVFLNSNTLLTSLGAPWRDGDEWPEKAPHRGILRSVDLSRPGNATEVVSDSPVGILMPVGEHHAVSFYDYPRLIDLRSGKTIHEWPNIASGTQNSSIVLGSKEPTPPIALDPAKRRFAVGMPEEIVTVQITL